MGDPTRDEYAPSTDVVRQAHLRPVFDSMDDAGEAFDRWLDDVKRAARAEGFNRAAEMLVYDDGSPVKITYMKNPYESEECRHVDQ